MIMKNRILSIGILLVFGLVANIKLQAQSGCIANIQKRLDVIGTEDFSIHKAREIIREFDFGNIGEFKSHPGKRLAFRRFFESLSEFIDLAPHSLSGEGLLGLSKYVGVSIRASDSVVTELNITHLKEAFSEAGRFKGDSLDFVLRKLGDPSRFDFDPTSKTFRSLRSGLKYANGPRADGSYRQGEFNAVNHILRGHTKNDFSTAKLKSVFLKPSEIFEIIDDVWLSPNRVPFSNNPDNNGWILDFSPRIVGTTGQTKVRIHVDGTNVRSAFPVL